MAVEGQITQLIHHLVSNKSKKTEKNEQKKENGEEQLADPNYDNNGTIDTQHDNAQIGEVVTMKTVHNHSVYTLEKVLEATELDENETNLQQKVMIETVAKVTKPRAYFSFSPST